LTGLHYHRDRQHRHYDQNEQHHRSAWRAFSSPQQLDGEDGSQEQHADRQKRKRCDFDWDH